LPHSNNTARAAFVPENMPVKYGHALGGIRTRTGLPPEDFTYHYRFRGLLLSLKRERKAVRGLDCLFAISLLKAG